MLLNSVRQYLSSHHMYVDDDWLAECVEYLTEDRSNNYNENDIKNLAKEQWLLNDLNTICPGSLPANLKNVPKTILEGRFVLQINATIDIGTPAYQQYLKLQKINMENVEATNTFEDKIPSHRMIKLYLTDGVQELTAIEYKPMRNMSCDITPGCKVLIKGPIVCRRGMLLLTEHTIELLGGEVQEIAVSNSLAGQLSTRLQLPITQDNKTHGNSAPVHGGPSSNSLKAFWIHIYYTNSKEMAHLTIVFVSGQLQQPDFNAISHPRNTNIPTLHTEMPPSSSTNTFDPPPDHRPVARVTSLQVASFNDDDDAIDVDQLAAIEEQMMNPVKRTLSETNSNPEKKFKMETQTNFDTIPSNNSIPSASRNRVEDYPDENDLFLDEDEDYLRELEAKIDAKENQLSVNVKQKHYPVEPFVYIKQLNDMRESDKVGRVFKVKGQIMKLLSKLSVGKEGWSLKCTIVDGTGSIDVEFTSDVLSKLVGFTPQEMNHLKKQMATNPELKMKAVSALQKAKDTLQVLYCIIEITILEVPKITCLTPFEAKHVELLKERLKSSC